MTRTEQYLRGYDSCRHSIQSILVEFPELQKNERLMKLASFPYYDGGGIDWHPECGGCKYWDLDIDWDLVCFKEMKHGNIKDKCDLKEVKVD